MTFAPTESRAQPLADAQFVGDNVVNCRTMQRPGGCAAWFLQVLPQTLDVDMLGQWDLIPADFQTSYHCLIGSNGQRGVLLYNGRCYQRFPYDDPGDPGCSDNWPPEPVYAGFRTIVDSSGEPLVLSERYLGGAGLQLAWDGSKFVHMKDAAQSSGSTAPVLLFEAFDPDGIPLVSGVRPIMTYSYPPNRLNSWRFVTVAPDDYVVVYTMTTSNYTYIARFRMVPL
ncbi:MAG: hypothetical protein HY906_24420 [Deltaproteobacteria bacterium]|nr:hypothetical protein [Deltaproteobacteria bacterium]